MPPKVSVIVRNHNRGERALNAVRCVLAQSFDDFELLFVDDASSDDSVAMLQSRYGDEPRLRIRQLAENQGAAGAANAGIEMARGEFVAFLDSDDEWLPDFLQVHVIALEANPRCVMTYSNYVIVWSDAGLERFRYCPLVEDQRRAMLQGSFIHTQSMTVIRTDAIRRHGGFQEQYRISQDYLSWLRFALTIKQPFLHIPQPLVRYFISTDSVTKNYDTWLNEGTQVIEQAYAHPAAAPYLDDKADAKQGLINGVMARVQIEKWLRKGCGQKITVILFAVDAAALDCLNAQSYRNAEVIALQAPANGALAQWQDALDLPLSIVSSDTNAGIGERIVDALDAAQGKIITFLQAGTRWNPDYLQQVMTAHSFPANPPVFSFADFTYQGTSRSNEVFSLDTSYTSQDLLAHFLTQPLPDASLSFIAARKERLLAIRDQLACREEALAFSLVVNLLTLETKDDGLPLFVDSPVYINAVCGACAGTGSGVPAEKLAAIDDFFASPTGIEYQFIYSAVVEAQLQGLGT